MIRINHELLHYITKLRQQEQQEYIIEQTIRPKETIIQQGKRVFSVYVIKKGIAKCYLAEDNGKEFIQEFFGEGELFGEIELINGSLSFCCIEAITDVEVYQIGHKQFQSWLANDKQFNELILKTLAAKIRYKAIRHAYHHSHTAEENLLRLVDTFPLLITTIAKPDIASYLGITIRSLNRIITGLKKRKLIN